MSLEICLSPLQKTLLVLAVKQEKGEETHFQDIQSPLDRDKSQVFVLLKSLEQDELIERTNTRPQKITLTQKGSELIHEQVISPSEYYLTHLNTGFENRTKRDQNDSSLETTRAILKKSEIIEYILKKVKPRIEDDLKTIDEYITAEQFDLLKDSLLERFESIITFLFSRLDVYKKPK
ncbi:MAG: hypothetical protein GF311_15180 [Candidatus Lokiarchaeota archaeon]|nr:hypothetical protein [Candidatus Lokiarchaeota archaeon]